jgi:cell division protein FtsW (lipid II flippase)
VGRGYMQPSDPGDIRPYQADDNLSAIHLMSPFGRIGAALLLLVLGVLAWRLGTPGKRADAAAMMGALVLWCLFTTAAYMVLGNLHLVPFTGRNIYLLAALSVSDLLEGGILFLILMRVVAPQSGAT